MTKDEPILTPELLLRAYAAGIFPMSEHRDDPEVFWIDPRRRGVLPLKGFHISRSLARRMRRGGYRVTLDADFQTVLDACANRGNLDQRGNPAALHRIARVGPRAFP